MRIDDLQITVVIATYNRFDLLKRALESTRRQIIPLHEVIVVDDCSTDETQKIKELYPEIRLLKQLKNSGPGPARNLGIFSATGNYVLILDDDDELTFDCTSIIYRRLSTLKNVGYFPVVQFAHSNGHISNLDYFRIITLEDYWSGVVVGDFQPLFNVERFKSLNLRYPDNKIGGESLLWWHIADEFGLPTWSDKIGSVNDDAPVRLTSVTSQIKYSAQHLALSIQVMNVFGERMKLLNPVMFQSRLLALFVYAKLSGDNEAVRDSISELRNFKSPLIFKILQFISLLPLKTFKTLFIIYRKANK